MTASVQLKKNNGCGSQGAWRQDGLAVNRQSYSYSDSELSSVVRRLPAGNGVSAEAAESSPLEAVTRKRLVEIVTD
jgi:hypothetical protein